MTVIKTGISWTDSSWNPTTGCTKVSAGCDHCYAEALTNRLLGGDFATVKLRPERLAHVKSFKPIRGENARLEKEEGAIRPRRVFVNSMSDLMHEKIPDDYRDQVFSAMESNPRAVFQVLTKRPMTLRRYISARYRSGGSAWRQVPLNVWLGVSVEDNRVKHRIDILRELKSTVGFFTAFLSVEPLIGPVDRHDYEGMDWVIIGGESGNGARPLKPAWAFDAIAKARLAGAAIWGKQWGTWESNPLYAACPSPRHRDRLAYAIAHGEVEAHEKGGATFGGMVFHELPKAYAQTAAQLNRQAGLSV